MNLSASYSVDANGALEVVFTAFRNNQTVHRETIADFASCDGTEQPVPFRGPAVNLWPVAPRFRSAALSAACIRIGAADRVLDVVLRSDGRVVGSSRRSISSEGVLIEVKSGITPSGEYYRSFLVWERK
jgi:hypothetical protein